MLTRRCAVLFKYIGTGTYCTPMIILLILREELFFPTGPPSSASFHLMLRCSTAQIALFTMSAVSTTASCSSRGPMNSELRYWRSVPWS